ncbi:PKD domain-containing protein [Aquimarina algiphila]|uniref:PKD domain-containing protein n=5 Tax=Aquimarina algiphila TaxID=2047982 RepID=A0A554VGB7_9FLAO|nr:PKD domain-containing protein [Aquimarina algiphila]
MLFKHNDRQGINLIFEYSFSHKFVKGKLKLVTKLVFMKKQLLCFLLMVCAITMGQETNAPNPLQEALQVFPVSPEAASLGKYGDIPVNLASGKINYTVPLYTIKVGGFEWPIYLSYNYGGLVTEQDHAMTGMGWDLMANGRITKQIRGMDDDFGDQTYKASTIVPYLQGAFGSLPSNEFSEKQYGIFKNIADNNYDAEQDKYNISVPGLDGSFVFNEIGDVVFLNHRNYTIEKNGDIFIVTNDSGIRYHFEIHETGTHHYSSGSESVTHTSPVSYLLTRVQLPNNKGDVYFTYGPAEIYTKRVYSESETSGFAIATETQMGYKDNILTRHRLQKITFPNGEVRFDTSNATDQGVATLALNGLSVWDANRQIMKYDFTYNDASKNRKTLLGITRSNGDDILPWYQFEYYPFPNTLPASSNYKYQDFWGYYNGIAGSLLSAESREIDALKTRSGALKKITYPTGGYSEITYEQNRVLATGDVGTENCSYSHNKTITKIIRSEIGVFDKVLDTVIEVPANQIVSAYARVVLGEGVNNSFIGAEVDFDITTVGEACTYENINLNFTAYGETIPCEPGVACPDTYEDSKSQTGFSSDGQVRIHARISTPIGTSAYVQYTIKYEDRTQTDDPHPYKYVGGIRVSQTTDCDGEGNCKTKNYSYRLGDGKHSGILAGSPAVFQYTTTHRNNLHVVTKLHKMAKSMSDVTSYQGSPVLYKQVEIIEEDGTNGKTRNQYSVSSNGAINFPFATAINNDWKKGKMLKSEVFKNQQGAYLIQRETINEYAEVYPYGRSIHSTIKAYGMVVGRDQFNQSGDNGSSVSQNSERDYAHNFYVDYPKEHKLIKTTTREFLDDKIVTNETSYTYDNPYGQLKTQTTTDSDNKTLTTTYSYPYDKNSTVNNLLVAQNRITTPVETQSKENTTILGTQVTEFIDWGNGMVLPGITKVAKGGDTPEPRLTYHNYDAQGNPLEVSQVDGRHIMYIWGYNNTQPIAKIDNASYTGIPAAVTTLINQLKTTSDTEDTATEETTMRTLFKNLREHAYFANAQISGYTYDPLIGVTSMTNPQGQTAYYRYDDMNRMQYALDQDQHVVQQVRYNYQGQQSDALGGVIIDTPGDQPKVPDQPATFTANTSGSGSANLYTWSVNGAQEQCGSGVSFTKTFTSEGTYEVKVLAYNTETKHRVSHTMSVIVKYPELTTPLVNANYTHIVKGTNVDFSASSIGGGTGNLRYEWYLNNVKQTSTTTTFRYNPNTAGTYNVYFKVIDNESGKSVNSAIRKLYAYHPLNTPNVSASKAHIERGTTTTFTASNIGGGSGSRRYEWYVNNVKQSATGTSYSYHFPNTGTYTIKFKVVDLTMQNANAKWGANSPVLKVYPKMVVSTSQSATSVSGSSASVSFNVTGISGGSGSRQTTWRAFKAVSPSQTAGSGTGTQFSFSNFATGTHEYNITATVKDNLTGKQVTRLMVVVSSISDEDCPNCGPQH